MLQADPAMLVSAGLLVDTLDQSWTLDHLASPGMGTVTTPVHSWAEHPSLGQGQTSELASQHLHVIHP